WVVGTTEFACTACGQMVRTAHPIEFGREVKCPHCKQRFVVAKPAIDPVAEVVAFAPAAPPVAMCVADPIHAEIPIAMVVEPAAIIPRPAPLKQQSNWHPLIWIVGSIAAVVIVLGVVFAVGVFGLGVVVLSDSFQMIADGPTGTGFVVAPDGYILTNYHVIAGPGRIGVRIPHVQQPVLARLVAQDPYRDLALIKIDVPAGVDLRPLPLAGSRPINRGEKVAAFGYPLGDVMGSGLKLTSGVVSALPEPGNENLLLLDIKVNPGNSGGPLCDASGNVVGMIAAKS